MTLIAIIVAVIAIRAQWIPAFVTERVWAERYTSAIGHRGWLKGRHPALHFGVIVLPAMALLWFIGTYQTAWYFELLDLLVAVFLLVSILSYRAIESTLQPFMRRWRNQEWQAAYEHGSQFFHYSKMISPSELLNQTITQYLLKINQFLFAPVLWFLIFGTAGLALYVLTLSATQAGLLEHNGNGDNAAWRRLAQDCLHALDGIPARLVAMSIALLSMNAKAFAVAVRRFRVTDRESEIVLKLATKMALEFKELPDNNEAIASEGVSRIHAVQDLRTNILILWMLIIAFFTLIGWIF